jgi:hypothetical protein
MNAPDAGSAKRPMLFPDPVIEFYMARIDRAAIRERLDLTPAQRLDALQQQGKARAENQTERIRERSTQALSPNEPAPPLEFSGGGTYAPIPDPAARPMLFPDPVVQAYMKDVDRTLIREQLKKSPTERLQSLIAMAEFWEEGRKFRAQKKNGLSRD